MTASFELRPKSPLPYGLTVDAMPRDFGDADAETEACRSSGALFDYSFLIRVAVNGPDAARAVSEFCGRDMSGLEDGGIRYALHADDDGHLLSDVTVWRTGPNSLEVMTGCGADVSALRNSLAPYDAQATDLSSDTACLAVQGPESDQLLAEIDGGDVIVDIPYFRFLDLSLGGYRCRVGRLGFTGLRGVELLCSARAARRLWPLLADKFRPAGFSAADRLRLMAGLALFNQDFVPPVTASEAGFAHLRPLGNTAGDRLPARVKRVCFTARRVQTSDQGTASDSSVWTSAAPFPPQAGTLAVTSVAPLAGNTEVIGMGYIKVGDTVASLREPSGNLEDIVVQPDAKA